MQDLSYETILHEPGQNVFVYLDPPYLSATDSKLYGMKGELHTGFDHERFAYHAKISPHRWLITYDDSPEVRKLFAFANMKEYNCQYGMNNFKQSVARKGNELIITNF
ncbi:MAG: DNA adenine methylase [Rhizonema sp. PD38]|nr:DNA adenine methylase [Rhizonema sp. PD38]